MSKKILALLLLFLTSCGMFGSEDYSKYLCPIVGIPRDTAYLKRISGHREDYLLEVKGYEGFCYKDTRSNSFKAVITPVFSLKRPQPTDEYDIHFSFYTETLKGPPEFLGRRTYFERVNMPLDASEIEFKGKAVEVSIPENMSEDFDINLGLVLTKGDKEFNKKNFDFDIDYINEE